MASASRREVELAKLRRRGVGIWHVIFEVTGFKDRVFEMLAPGDLNESFAVMLVRQTLAKELDVSWKKDVKPISTWMEPP